ncbi:acyl--CoA ligase [Gordonia sp. TBRC 11910]|uniref:Acyl--CoA ligase n=1 Tax=Gordonia asplenii TaxID=2725283 RepID=A0A848KW10_9ACTN|nr:class I adenylate-forming enzyme family protein [Gordonia asplenii]NMO02770.1 acyl--CoA ligase [Gordonia asplenii]
MTDENAQTVDPQQYIGQVMGGLLGPGGPFEQVVEDVLGVRMPVMANRDKALGDVLDRSRAFGDRDYVVTADRRISYVEHADAAAALATALRDRYGVAKGDRVGILAANSIEWVISFWAIQALGAIAVGYNSWWAPREVAYGLGHTTPEVVIADAKRNAVLADLGTDVPVIVIETDLPDLLTEFAGSPLPRVDVGEEDPAVILYTSGTSGRPKGAVHSQRNVLAVIDYHRFNDALSAALRGQAADGPSDLRYLLTSPLFHIASLHNLVIPRLATGSAVIMYQGGFDPERALSLIEQEKVTSWGAVPTMAQRLMDFDGVDRFDTSSMTAFALASAPSSIAFQQRLRDRLPFAQYSLVDSYGLTECGTAVAVASPLDLAAAPGTLGRPIVGVAVEIRDPLGEKLPDGAEGEICVRSPYVMLGYWNDDAATRAAITDDRWLRTGDYGQIDDGRVRLTGRRSDLILRGGENIYPVEIEQALDEHPAVHESAVVGVPDDDLGQSVAAIVVVDFEDAVTEAELAEFLTDRLAYFKVPARWRITTTPLPRNATGKTMRQRIQI